MEYTVDIRLIHVVLTAVFSFLIGLEIKTYQLQFHAAETKQTIGSVRTLTFVGVLGYLFWILDGRLYLAGFAAFTLLYTLFYLQQLREGRSSILIYLTLLVVYSFGPLTERFALWLPSLLFVLTIFTLNAKQRLRELSQRLNAQELETLGKMVLLSAVVLPLLPHKKLGAYLPLSPFEIWMAVVIVSAISYSGYLAQKYFFRQKGYLLAGLIGGLYSSTATTVVLARKASEIGNTRLMTAATVAATAMMYLRLIAVAAIFNLDIAKALLLPFTGFALAGMIIAVLYAFRHVQANSDVVAVDTNPLELRTAFVFAGLFIGMMALTQLVTVHYGTDGLRILSFIVGFTDIDPFVLSLLTGHYAIGEDAVVSSVMIAAGSNNLLKALYAVWFGGVDAGKTSAGWLLLLGLMTIALAFVM